MQTILKSIVTGLMLFFVTSGEAFSEDFEATKKDEWFRCADSSECLVIDVSGCPWGISAVNRRYSREFREWAEADNARHDCYKNPDAYKKTVRMFDAECVNERCVIRDKVVKSSE